MKHIQRLGAAITISLVFFALACYGQGTGGDLQCLGCHGKVYENIGDYLHPPFVSQKCITCHIRTVGDTNLPPAQDEKHGAGLRTRDEIGIEVCYQCHSPKNLGLSHPVNVYPTKKIKIPDLLPTGQEGKLLCITCHWAHTSNEKYLGRKPVSAQLCIVCHGEGYFK